MKRITNFAAAVAVLLSSGMASAAPFDIQINYTGPAILEFFFKRAELFWESQVTGYAGDNDPGPLIINASITRIDGPGGVLGQAGPTFTRSQGGFVYATRGVMEFDIADTLSLLRDRTFDDVILHEMAHVMGLGTLWTANGVYENNSGEYTGEAGLAAYQEEFDANAEFIPVELQGGPGTANGHWDEDWAGGSTELMTGFLDPNPFVSNTTVQSFVDIGYSVANQSTFVAGAGGNSMAGQTQLLSVVAPVPLPAGSLLMITAVGGFAFAARRQRKAA